MSVDVYVCVCVCLVGFKSRHYLRDDNDARENKIIKVCASSVYMTFCPTLSYLPANFVHKFVSVILLTKQCRNFGEGYYLVELQPIFL